MSAPTKQLAEFAVRQGYEQLPPNVLEHLKLCILDAIGAALFGTTKPWSSILAEVAKNWTSMPSVTLWGRGSKSDLLHAVLVNGAAVHAFELDDNHMQAHAHLGSQVLPAPVAMAEVRGPVDGRALLTALAVGYEVNIRVGMCCALSMAHRGFNAQGACATFGSAAAVGNLIGLGVEEMVHAFGIAGTQAGGLQGAMYGAMVKRMQPARGCQGGLFAALLAEQGYTGITGILDETEYGGFLKAFADVWDIAQLTDQLGKRWEILNIGFKPYSAVRSCHSTIDAVLYLRKAYSIDPAKVDEILVEGTTITRKYASVKHIVSPTAAQLSLQYSAAVALLEGHAFVDQYTEEKIRDRRILELADKVRLEGREEFDAEGSGARYHVRVTIAMKDKSRHTTEVYVPLGHPSNPLSPAQLRGKFDRLVERSVGRDRGEQIARVISRLEDIRDIRELTALL